MMFARRAASVGIPGVARVHAVPVRVMRVAAINRPSLQHNRSNCNLIIRSIRDGLIRSSSRRPLGMSRWHCCSADSGPGYTYVMVRSYRASLSSPGFKSDSSDSGRDLSPSSSSEEQHRLFQEQLIELKEEREALFGFTQSDQDAWSTSGGAQHKHDQSFLDEINQARMEAYYAAEVNVQESTVATGVPGSKAERQWTDPSSPPAPETITTERIVEEDVMWWSSPASNQGGSTFSHVSEDEQSARMVDVGSKRITQRVAVAQSRVVFPPDVVEALLPSDKWTHQHKQQNDDLVGPKGPIFATAKLAGIMAAKYARSVIIQRDCCHFLCALV